MAPDRSADEFVEIYTTDSPDDARRIRDVILRPQGIDAVLHDRTDHVLPAPSAQPGEICLAVPNNQVEEAMQILREFLAAEGEQTTVE